MRALALAVALLLVAGACSSSDSDGGYDRDGWDQGRLDELAAIGATVGGSEIGCTEFGADPWQAFVLSYKEVELPMPAASMSCTSADEEDLTFEAFTDSNARDAFIDAKVRLLCDRGYEVSPEFPGLPYVDGGTWIIEPDTVGTANDLAELLGDGATSRTMCTPPDQASG